MFFDLDICTGVATGDFHHLTADLRNRADVLNNDFNYDVKDTKQDMP